MTYKFNQELTKIYNQGFAAKIPNKIGARRGLYIRDIFSAQAKALIFWDDIIRPQKGSELELKIFDPLGGVFYKRLFKIKKSREK